MSEPARSASYPALSRREFLRVGAAGGAAVFTADLKAAAGPPAVSKAGRNVPAFELEELTMAELQARMASGQDTARSLLERYLERIRSLDQQGPALRQILEINPDALSTADALDAERKAGKLRGPLHGLPILLKDNIATADRMTTTAGSLALEGCVAPRDAFIVERLRAAGAILLAKTNMSEWANFRSMSSTSGWSARGGLGRNPYALDRNTSGSSSGAAAAAVAGYAPLHVGTDIGGSVRLPATHCGIFALKPSLGRVPIAPPYMGRVAGPMTRGVADSALMMQVLSKPDARDFMSLPVQDIDWSSRPANPKGLKIGVLPDMKVGLHVRPEVRAACKAAAKALEAQGAEVSALESFLTPGMLDGTCRFFEARSYHDLMQLSAERRAKVLPFIAEWCTWRAAAFSGRDVMQAYGEVMAMREAAVRACAPFDFVLSPVSPILAYEAELPAPNDDPRDALPHIAFTVPYNMSEQPAASVNWGYGDEGLPIGVQVIGRRFDDAGVRRLCALLERLRPPQRAWPDSV